MEFLNKEIERLTKRRKTPSLVKPEISCGIFQTIDARPKADTTKEDPS